MTYYSQKRGGIYEIIPRKRGEEFRIFPQVVGNNVFIYNHKNSKKKPIIPILAGEYMKLLPR